MSTRKERSSSNGSPGTTPTPPPASGLQTEEGTATRPRASSSETPANQAAAFDPSMMEKFFSFMSFYEQHQQGAPAQSNNSNNNNNVTPMSLDGSSYARGNQQQQPTFAPYEPQRSSVSFMPQPQPAPGQERTLDALQVQSQFAHVLKLQTTKPFDGKDFFTWSFEFELMMEGAQILGFFDGSLPYPTNGTQYEKQQYTYQSMMAYTILLRNVTPTQQQNIRSYRGYGNSTELVYNHLKSLYQATDSVNQRSISEDAFVTVVIGGLGPHWRSTRAILRAHGKISETALRAEIHAEQQDMDLQEERHKRKEFKLYHGKGGLYIGKAVLKNNVFVLDFVPDLGTGDSDGIVTFTSWTHPSDLDPDFSPEGFWYSHTIPEAERTRALVTIQHSAAAETTSAAAETSSTVAGTTTVAATTTSVLVDEAPPTPAQQLKPAQREVHRSANFTASFYSNSDMYRRSLGHRASEDIWHARMGHPMACSTGPRRHAAQLVVVIIAFEQRITASAMDRKTGQHKNVMSFRMYGTVPTPSSTSGPIFSTRTVGTTPRHRKELQCTYLANLQEDQDPTGGFRGDRAFASAADEADWDEQNVANASEEAGPLPFCSVDVPMDEDNPRESLNAETFYYFADNGYVTPATVNTNEAERVGPNFIPDPEAGDEAAYPEDATLPRYSQTGLQILGLVTAVHGNTLPKEPATVQQALGGEHREK
ncbi:unnamed protein product [Closterium sp. NIES-54]